MILPSIDIMGGRAVQLVGGEALEIDAGDPWRWAERFGVAGELAVIDLDAALGQGENRELIETIVRRWPCRVGGGIRDAGAALRWLDAGATQVILGTAARPEILGRLPAERVIAALDARDGEVVVDGWRTRTGVTVERRIDELAGLAGAFMVTFVEREGRMAGIDVERVRALAAQAAPARLTVAGGVTSAAEVAAIDAIGADCQVGMALYKGTLSLADALAAMLHSDRGDGLWPTVVTDEHGYALGLTHSNATSLRLAIDERRGVYWSRRRGLWRKGESSGAVQDLLRVDLDCDRDALRFTVRQGPPGFCHLERWACFDPPHAPGGSGLGALARRLAARLVDAPDGSYTARLLADADLLRAKLLEEAGELAAATGAPAAAHEAADVVFFALVRAMQQGADLASIEAELDRRGRRVRRRGGDPEPR